MPDPQQARVSTPRAAKIVELMTFDLTGLAYMFIDPAVHYRENRTRSPRKEARKKARAHVDSILKRYENQEAGMRMYRQGAELGAMTEQNTMLQQQTMYVMSAVLAEYMQNRVETQRPRERKTYPYHYSSVDLT